MNSFGFLLLFSAALTLSAAPPPVTCPAGAPIGNIDLRVATGGKDDALPLRTINRLSEGDTIRYAPILRTGEKRPGEVSMVLVPAVPASPEETVVVLEPRPANKPAEWKVQRKISVVAFVYGPDGLNRGRVQTFLAKDSDLVSQLADYAEKTTQTEALIQALTQIESSPVTVNAALEGFASQYGLNNKIDKTQPVDQQAMALFRTVNPAMEGADPLAPGSYQRVGQTASIATSVAGLFFGSPVGLAAGGTAMVLDLRSLAFPKTDFRSSLAEKLPSEGLALCGKKTPPAPHTKVAYLWASRIPNTAPPAITIGAANSIPATQDSPIPVEVSDTDWKYLDRVRNWQLIADNKPAVPVTVRKTGDGKSLEIDLSKAKVIPGTWKLAANWDWDPFTANGELHVQPLGNMGGARLDPASQDQLIAGRGKVRATLVGDDFEFATAVEFQHSNDEFSKPEPVPFVLPKGLRRGPQQHLDLLVDTKDLDPGAYQFLLTQVDGRSHSIPFQVLPPPPSIDNLPLVISRGDKIRQVTLKGRNLDLLTRLEATKGSVALGPSLPHQNERAATIEVPEELEPGSAFALRAYVSGHNEPLTLNNAVHVVGPRPSITSIKLSPPSEVSIPLQPGELSAGVYVSGMLEVDHLMPTSGLRLGCEGQTNTATTLHMGEHSATASMQPLSGNQVFVSFDSTGWPAGCTIVARVDNGPDGLSDPVTLGKLVRFPKVETFRVTSSDAGSYTGELVGTGLEIIDKVGWSAQDGVQIADLPAPIPGEGMKQSLKVTLPGAEPVPHAPLYVWLRGDREGRATNIRN